VLIPTKTAAKMSLKATLSTLNNAWIISALGAGTLVFLERPQLFLGTVSLSAPAVKVALVTSYALDVACVSISGRIDDQVASAIAEGEGTAVGKKSDGEVKSLLERTSDAVNPAISNAGVALAPVGGRTLVAPAGWAFAIWGPIFLGEFLSVAVAGATLTPSSSCFPIFQKIALPFVSAHLFQCLWCASFREKYSKIKGGILISGACLAGTAFSLGKVNAIVVSASASGSYTFAQYLLYFFPMSLHFGWTTAATLVNLNAAIALDAASSPLTLAVAGIGTSVVAAVGGAAFAILRGSPVFSGVISWALFAVADGMRKRIRAEENQPAQSAGGSSSTLSEEPTGMYGAKWQLRVSTAGAWICAIVTAVVGYRAAGPVGGYVPIGSS